MFKCGRCNALADEVKALREQNSKLVDRLTAIADQRAFAAVSASEGSIDASEYYGGDDDEYVEHNAFGERIAVKKEAEH